MPDSRYDAEFLKKLFHDTEVLRKPISGIISGYHVLPFILVGPQEERSNRSVEIRSTIKVSPRLVISPSQSGQTYGELFRDSGLMDQTLIARVFGFLYTPRHHAALETEEIKITKSDRDPKAQIDRALDELARREIINTGLIFCPNVRFYPVSIERFITEILDQEFR